VTSNIFILLLEKLRQHLFRCDYKYHLYEYFWWTRFFIIYDLPYHTLKDGYSVFSPTSKYLTSLLLMNYRYDEFFLCNIQIKIMKI